MRADEWLIVELMHTFDLNIMIFVMEILCSTFPCDVFKLVLSEVFSAFMKQHRNIIICI